uniref:DNA-repair protein UVH3, putative n=1 Tax=Arundo donax TaxID=35708 RepID=A0A0A9DFU8_ARUDO
MTIIWLKKQKNLTVLTVFGRKVPLKEKHLICKLMRRTISHLCQKIAPMMRWNGRKVITMYLEFLLIMNIVRVKYQKGIWKKKLLYRKQ